MKEIERFIANIEVHKDGCWLWVAGLDAYGYGQFYFYGRRGKTHRFSYEYFKKKIEKGLAIDHLCRNRRCVNPEHLEEVTLGENILRGEGIAAKNKRKTHCLRGHEFDTDNLSVRFSEKGLKVRRCRKCMRMRTRRMRARHKLLLKVKP